MKIKLSVGTGKRISIKALDKKMFVKKDTKAEDMALSKQRLETLQPNTMVEVVSLLQRFLKRDIPVMLIGSSGFGKSALIRQAAKNIPGFPVEEILDIRAGMLNVEDLRGLPMLVKDAENLEQSFTRSTVPSWLKKVILNPNKNYVLFFDELNHASAAVLNSVYGIILERTLEDFDFNDRVRIVAAGNKSEQNEDLTELSDPLVRRLEIIDIDKAIDINMDYYENFLRDKYKDLIPKEILDLVLGEGVATADARSVDRTLKAWSEDIVDGETVLTRSGAIPGALFAKIQKIYSQKYIRTTGSEAHRDMISEIVAFAQNLKKTRPEFFESAELVYNVSDLLAGKVEGVKHESDDVVLSAAGRDFIVEHFKDQPEEFIVAALDKFSK